MEKKTQFNRWYLIAAIIDVLWLHSLWLQSRQIEQIPYSKFEQLLKEGNILIKRGFFNIKNECFRCSKRLEIINIDPIV
jgi:hypothetical protein